MTHSLDYFYFDFVYFFWEMFLLWFSDLLSIYSFLFLLHNFKDYVLLSRLLLTLNWGSFVEPVRYYFLVIAWMAHMARCPFIASSVWFLLLRVVLLWFKLNCHHSFVFKCHNFRWFFAVIIWLFYSFSPSTLKVFDWKLKLRILF